MFFSSAKEINRLLIKGMWNIYLKATKLTFSKLYFLVLKSLSPALFLGNSNSSRYSWIFKLKKSEVWEENCVWLFYYFNFENKCDVLKLTTSPYFLLNKNLNYNNEAESKMENEPCASAYITITWIKSKTVMS